MAVVDTLNSLGKLILPKDNSIELTVTDHTVTIDPNLGSYFFLDGIDSNLNISMEDLNANSKAIYIKLNFAEDDIVIRWPSNINWFDITSPSTNKYEDLFISLMTLDGGETWYSEPLIKTKPWVDTSFFMRNRYPANYSYLSSVPQDAIEYLDNVRPTSYSHFFDGCSSLRTINASELNMRYANNIDYMFSGCSQLSSIDISDIDFSKFNSLSGLFCACNNLSEIIGLSNMDTHNVTTLNSMFYGCSGLDTLDLSSWDVSNVTNIEGMFTNTSISNLDLSNWDTRKMIISNNVQVFSPYSSLTLNISNMILGDYSLRPFLSVATIYDDIDTSHVTRFSNVGYLLSQKIGLENVDMSSALYLDDMFGDIDSSVSLIDVGGLDTSNVISMSGMFKNCSNVREINGLDSFDTSNVTSMAGMFNNCTNLLYNSLAPIGYWDTSSLTNISMMFYHCDQVVNLPVSSWDTSKVTDMSQMFGYCGTIISLNLSQWDTSKVTNMSGMFGYCQALNVLDISSWDTSSAFVGPTGNDKTNLWLPYYLRYLIIESEEVKCRLTLPEASALPNLRILVPRVSIQEYMNDSAWRSFSGKIEPIENYKIYRSTSSVSVLPITITVTTNTVIVGYATEFTVSFTNFECDHITIECEDYSETVYDADVGFNSSRTVSFSHEFEAGSHTATVTFYDATDKLLQTRSKTFSVLEE